MNKKIYFLSPSINSPTGGIKQLYRQVDILNENGFDATIVHKKKYYRYKWSINNTKTLYNYQIFNQLKTGTNKKNKISSFIKKSFYKFFNDSSLKDGIVVIPEIYIQNDSLPENIKFIIYNQNCYYSFENYNKSSVINAFPYFQNNVLGIIINSSDGYDYLHSGLNLPENKLYKINLGIDTSIFYFKKKTKRQIAFMPRKLYVDLNQVINILKIRANLKSWNFVSIDNKNEYEVAEILKDSAIFLSFNDREGLGLPPLEAMACGCLVVGYHGNGGKEYFHENNSMLVEERNIIDFVLKIEKACFMFDAKNKEFHTFSKNATNTIINRYTLANEERSTLEIYNLIIKNNPIL